MNGLFINQPTQQHHQGGVEVQDESLQTRRDILQPQEIKVAGQVVTHKAQQHDVDHIAPGQRVLTRHRLALRPQAHRDKKRQGDQHAIHDDRDRIDTIQIGQLDDDGLAAKSHRTASSQ